MTSLVHSSIQAQGAISFAGEEQGKAAAPGCALHFLPLDPAQSEASQGSLFVLCRNAVAQEKSFTWAKTLLDQLAPETLIVETSMPVGLQNLSRSRVGTGILPGLVTVHFYRFMKISFLGKEPEALHDKFTNLCSDWHRRDSVHGPATSIFR